VRGVMPAGGRMTAGGRAAKVPRAAALVGLPLEGGAGVGSKHPPF